MNIIRLLKLAALVFHGGIVALIGVRALILLLAESRASAGRFVRSAISKLLVLVLLECGAYGYVRYVEPNWITVTRVRLVNDRLAAALGSRRIVQVTDLHIERVGRRERDMITQVNRQRPDWIVITGDLLNARAGWPDALQVVSRLKATYDVWVVPGNTDNSFLTPEEFQADLTKIGAHVLRNARAPMAQTGAWLIGVDDPVEHQDQLADAMKGLSPDAIPKSILLAHAPDILPAAVEAHLPLVLAGHTHGGQVGIGWIRRLSDYANRGPYVAGGLYRERDTQLYVNRGIGWKKIPHRFLAPPEVTVIQFRSGRAGLFGWGKRHASTEASGDVWLADFESPEEHIIRWRVDRAGVKRVTAHATHGEAAAEVTFHPGPYASIRMTDYLKSDRARSDWRRSRTLAFDLYNAQTTSEVAILQVRDRDGREHREEVTLKGHETRHVSLPLAEFNEQLDRAHIVQLSVARPAAATRAIFVLDALRLESRPTASSAAAGGTATSPTAARSSLQDAAVTPDHLGGWRFMQQIDRWRVADPATGGPRIRVPVTLVSPELPLSVGFSVSGGVPFAMGQLPPDAAVQLHDLGGTTWPIQTRPLATWEDGSVKWLLVTTQVPALAKGRQLWLEYGSSVAREAMSASRVHVQDTPQAVTVSTGPLQFVVSKQRFTLFESAVVDRNRDGVFAEDERLASAGDLVVKFRNTEFHSARDTQSYKLEVEESGPLRATLKASGWYRDAGGRGFCQFIVRLQAFAGLPQVRIYHTIIYTGYPANLYHGAYEDVRLPENETVQEIRLDLPVTVASPGATLLTADERKRFAVPLDAVTTITQNSIEAYQYRRGDQPEAVEGAHHAGWVVVQQPQAGVMIGMRDAWQQFPNEWVVDPSAGVVRVKLWPASAGELDLQTGPEAFGPDAAARGSAFGLGKTHELWVGFLGASINPETAGGLAGLWQEPWLLTADPAWLHATDAWGTIGGVQHERFPEHETMLEDLFAWADRQPKHFGWYGMLNYGDTMTWYRKDAYDKSYDEWGWHPEGRWGWHNCEAVGSHGGAFMSFVRSLDLKYFRFAEAKARHVMDVDTVHYNTVANDPRLAKKISDEFSQVGSMHRHNAYHWGGRNEEATHTNVTGLLMYYYLTGYDRALDVAKESGGFLLRDPVTYTKHPDLAPSRALGNVLWGDVSMYQATWDRRYRVAADRWARVLLKGQQPDGTWLENYNPKTMTWNGELKTNYVVFHILPALIAYHRLTGNADVAKAIVKGTDAMIAKEPLLQFFDALAYTSMMTGHGEYLNLGLERIRELVRSQAFVKDPAMNGTVFEKAIYDRVGPVLYTVPFVIGAMDAPDFPTLAQSFPRRGLPSSTPPRPAQTGQGDSAAAAAQAGGSYEVLVVPSTEKVFPKDQRPASAHGNPAVLSLARNEYESVQLVLRARAPLQQVTVEMHDLTRTGGGGVIPRDALTWSLVGFVNTAQPDYDVSRVGWWPDPLLDPEPFAVQAGWWQPVWLTVYASAGTPAGEYAGTVTIRPGNAPPTDVEVKVRVWDFDLPATPMLKSAFDVYPARIDSAYRQFFPQWWPRVQGRTAQVAQQMHDDLLRRHLAPMLHADLDRPDAMNDLRRLRAKGLGAFAIGRYGGSFDNNWPTDGKQLDQLQPVYRSYGYQLRDAKLIEQHYIYTYDEPQPGLPHVADVARMVHQADPQLRNLVTLGASTDVTQLVGWLKDIDIVCLRNAVFDPAHVAALQRMGKEVWLYVSGPKPPYPTLVIDYPSIAYRILPWMCWKYGIRGLLYWSVNYWTTNPYEQPMNTPWQQNGNGSLYYPGPEGPRPSLRLEVLRDGMEDYEYLSRLRHVIQTAKASGRIDAATLARAEQLATMDDGLVGSLRAYSQDPEALLARRQAIAEMIEKLQAVQRPGT